MIDTDSPLYCLNGFARRLQVLFDGIRLSAETIDVAMERLQRQLDNLATTGKTGDLAHKSFAEAFIDAWAIVDALDRFRQLYVMFVRQTPEYADFSFSDRYFDQIKKLRDVDQHISKKVEQVVAKKGTALGVLRWTTLLFDGSNSIIESVLLPGSPHEVHHDFSLPHFLSEPLSATPRVVLEAGPYRAELNECINRAKEILRSIEVQVAAAIASAGLPPEHNVDQLISVMFVPVKEDQALINGR